MRKLVYGGEGLPLEGVIFFRIFFAYFFLLRLETHSCQFCRNRFIIYLRYRPIVMKFVEIMKIFRGATPLRLYGFSSPKGDITCPRVHGTFPENLVQIGLYLLFFSSYAKFRNFAKKRTFYFFTQKWTIICKN